MTTDSEEQQGGPGRPEGTLFAVLRWLNGTPALLLTLTALFWAGNAIAGQLAKDEVAPFMLVLLRWIGVTLVLWPLYGHEVRAHWATIRPALPRIVVMATAGFTCFNALFYAASHSTTGINIGILQGSMPMFVLAGAFLVYGTPVGRVQALGVFLTLIGVVLVATKGAPALIAEQGVNPGDALMLVACVLYSGYTVALRNRPAIPGRAFFTLMCPIAALTAVPFALGEAVIAGASLPTFDGWLVTLYVTVFPSCLAQLFFLRGVDLIGPGRAGVYINLVPIFAALLAVMILGETFAFYHAAALAMVLGGIWLSQRSPAP
ncbi:MAG: DMT family transporter [Pseudomonadota bacterium]